MYVSHPLLENILDSTVCYVDCGFDSVGLET